jgi:hypothetical protein
MIETILKLLSEFFKPLFLLDWATMSVSLFNVIVLTWLGLTVLLNSERRRWGVWLAGSGLLLGGAFFVAHTAMLGHGLRDVSAGMDFWWQVGWVPVVALPYAWYVVMLWYSGFWDDVAGEMRRRHRLLFGVATLMFVGLVLLFVFFNPLPSYTELVQLSFEPVKVGLTRLQLLAVFYPIYALLCIGLSLDVVVRPGPTGRVMGDLARRRARPWLAATSFVLVAVGVIVAWAIIWLVLGALDKTVASFYNEMEPLIYWFDLLTASLVAVAITLLGQAIVAYEIFTGKTLPRRGFVRQWRGALLLAVMYSAVVGASEARQEQPIVGSAGLLLTTVLMSVFFALFSWRSYAERERYIDSLRPFVTSQGLFDELLATTADGGRWTVDGGRRMIEAGNHNEDNPKSAIVNPQSDHSALHVSVLRPVHSAFMALCHEVLGVRAAYLVAVGPLSPLVGPPLTYPASVSAKLPPINEITSRLDSPQVMYLPVDPLRWGGAAWAVPLWSERGLIGVLLLGDKWDGGLFAQEEIEIARATGERLIDTQASAQLAGRLMHLQRQRLVESQVLDRRARRVLHDDVLPLLHTALLDLMSEEGRRMGEGRRTKDEGRKAVVPHTEVSTNGYGSRNPQSAIHNLSEAHHLISDLLRDMPSTAAPEIGRLGLVGALRKAVEEELAEAFDSVEWQVDPEAGNRLSDISPLAMEVVYYAAREAIRNSARYARPADSRQALHLKIALMWRDGLEILVEDDGIGIAPDRDEGRSTKDEGGSKADDGREVHANGVNGSSLKSGGGHGLALHSTMMAVVGGSLAVESAPGEYTRVVLSLPASS